MKLFPTILIPITIAIIILATFLVFASTGPEEQLSPSDTIQENQIKITENGILIDIDNAILVSYHDTNSMDPLMDAEANGIEIPITENTQLNIGDIISYNATWNETLVSHRIIDIQEDEEGTFYTLKGDNNSTQDPGKIRIEQIKYKLIGILY